jgi:hypothetical protein
VRPALERLRRCGGCGARAHFAGSSGAIVGTYRDEAMLYDLKTRLGQIGCRVLVVDVVPYS